MRSIYARITLSPEDLRRSIHPPAKSFLQMALDERLKADAAAGAALILAARGVNCIDDMPAWKTEIDSLLNAIGRGDLIDG